MAANEHSSDGAGEVWRTVWSALDDFVEEARRLFGSHLRHDRIELRAIDGDASQRGVLSIGGTHLLLESPSRCAPPSPEEESLAPVFGGARPLARIFVRRRVEDGPPGWQVESTFVADPASRVWITTEPELGPTTLSDLASLEQFFWYLLIDRPSTSSG